MRIGRPGFTQLAAVLGVAIIASCAASVPVPTHGRSTPSIAGRSTPSAAGGSGLTGVLAVSEGIDGIFLFDLATGQLTRLTDTPYPAFDADWSPDGSRLVFRAEPDGNSEIFVMNADGTDAHDLTHDPAADFAPAWSPDGGLIAFASDRAPALGRGSDIFVMAPDGSGVRRVAGHRGVDEYPDWSPDGKRLVFSGAITPGSDQDIYVVDVDGSQEINLTGTPDGNENQPAWSPDGQTIVFNCGEGTCGAGDLNADHDLDIYAIGPDGSNYHNLTDSPAEDRDTGWSPDARLITFLRYPGGRYVMNADGSDVRPIEIGIREPVFAQWRPTRP